jgi:hypothetical protein
MHWDYYVVCCLTRMVNRWRATHIDRLLLDAFVSISGVARHQTPNYQVLDHAQPFPRGMPEIMRRAPEAGNVVVNQTAIGPGHGLPVFYKQGNGG